jgi:hypothetical protein
MLSMPSMRIPGRNRGGTGVAVDDSLQQKAAQVPIPQEESTKDEDIQESAADQNLDAAVPEKKASKGEGVEKAVEEEPKKMDGVHQESPKNEETQPDEVLKGWAAPQGDELRQVDEIKTEQPDGTQDDEVSRAGKVPMVATTPVKD